MLPNFIADENIDIRIIGLLRKSEINIISIYNDYRGARDIEIVKLAKEKGAILITEDKDFGEWVFSHKRENISVILLRYKHREEDSIGKSLLKLIFSQKIHLHGKFVVISPKRIRIREIF